jgi:hypothetical protein
MSSSLLSSIRVSRHNSLVGICISPTAATERRFHIAFLLDVSGSMQGERLSTVQRTLRLFVEQMHEEDRVSIITYNGDAKVLCNAAQKSDIPTYVDRLQAGGGTNMEVAILALRDLDLETLDAVFLLTDGEVNQGITSVSGLDSLIQMTVFGPHTIPVYTLGYGEDHNAKLLQALAVNTRASYTFAETNEMIPSVVGSILVAMRDEVAKGVVVEWGGEAICWERGAKAGSYCVGSVIANKPQWVILKGPVTALRIRTSNSPFGDIPLPWVDANAVAAAAAADEVVLEQWFRAEAARVFTEVTELTPMGALPKLQALEDEILASSVSDRPMLLRIRAQIAEQREYLDTMAAMPPMPPHGPFNFATGATLHAPTLTRFVSNAAAFATQRGDMPEFNSPTQRMVSATMVAEFSQDPTVGSEISQLPTGLPGMLPNFLRRM